MMTALKMVVDPFILRRLKTDVSLDLPQKMEQRLYCELNPDQSKRYQELCQSDWKVLQQDIQDKGIQKCRFHVFSLLMKLRQLCCHPKLLDPESEVESEKFTVLQHRLLEIMSSGTHKVIIFSQFLKVLDYMKPWLKEAGIQFGVLTGKTRKRDEVIISFNGDPDMKVLLVSLKTGGVGINLTAADYVFIMDPWWNPAVESQAMDRVHRIGQDKPVFVYKIIAKNTVEEKIQAIQDMKSELYKEMFMKPNQLVDFLELEELKDMFSTQG